MVAAIIAAVVTLLVLAAIAAAVFVALRRRKANNVGAKRDVQPIGSADAPSMPPDADDASPPAEAAMPSGVHSNPVVSPAEGLNSRFVAFGVFMAAVFGSLGAKLWSMQMLSSDYYEEQAEDNSYTTVYTPAPRGCIYDADGVAIVSNKASLTVLADSDVADDHDVVQRLSTVLGVPTGVVRARINDTTGGAQSQRVVASGARLRDVAFIAEHADAFNGITVQTRAVRDYPYGALASHVLGYVGTVTEEQLAVAMAGRDIQSGDTVGQAGVEYQYDSLLAGDHGERKVLTDANGDVVDVVSETQPVKGSDVYLTIKAPVQYVADTALAELIAPDGVIGSGSGTGGCVIVMDVNDGGIVAMASYPNFSPEGGITTAEMDVYNSEEAYTPLLNRAIQGSYPAASTYKPFSALAALETGVATTSDTWTCTGSWDGFGSGEAQACWEESGHGTLDLRGGIVNSCDVVFYEIAYHFWEKAQEGTLSETALQDFLAKYRLESTTGIDLTGETTGRIPTPEWKKSYYANYPEEASWQGGDYTNMIIGQGYVLVTPIEMACAYGAIATGNIVKPHVLKEVRNSNGDVAGSYQPEVVSTPDVLMADLAIVRDALNGVATDNSTTAAQFEAVGIDPSTVACKTGTAEYTDMADTAWFACYAPYDDPQYVVVCVVEHGGGGSAVAGPLGAQVMAAALQAADGTLTDVDAVAAATGQSTEDAGAATGSGRTD